MPLDKTKYYVLIDKIIDIFSDVFDEDIFLVEKQVAIEHMFKELNLENREDRFLNMLLKNVLAEIAKVLM